MKQEPRESEPEPEPELESESEPESFRVRERTNEMKFLARLPTRNRINYPSILVAGITTTDTYDR